MMPHAILLCRVDGVHYTRVSEPSRWRFCPSCILEQAKGRIPLMSILQHLAGFGLQQLVDGACKVLGVAAGVQAGEAVAGFLGRRFRDHSQRLAEALVRSADQAWRA